MRYNKRSMEVRIDMDFFDNFEDGQLSMFDMAESLENLQTPAEEKVSDAEPRQVSASRTAAAVASFFL